MMNAATTADTTDTLLLFMILTYLKTAKRTGAILADMHPS
jgi:hypothetical protein